MIVVKPSPHGRGVFAARPITIGERILEFTGPLVDFDGAMAKGKTQCNVLQIDDNLYIDIVEPGVLVNHSCNPNAGVRYTRYLEALCDIAEGEHITFDYSTTMGDASWEMSCACKATTCRKLIQDFESLTAERQQHYLLQAIVQPYLVRRQQLQLLTERLRTRISIGSELARFARAVSSSDGVEATRRRAGVLAARWSDGL